MVRKGFTLIELLVVITILAILAGAALPYVQSYVAESRIAKAKTDLEEIARAIAVYETREGDYPDTGTDTADGLSDVSQLTGRYLNKAPTDPWGKPYVVNLFAGIVSSGGPDRDDATTEDNISAPFQPPLALVQVKWVDKNQTGAVDDINVPDEVHLYFSRKLDITGVEPDTTAVLGTKGDAIDTQNPADMSLLFELSSLAGVEDLGFQFDIASAKILPNRKVIVLPVKGAVAEAASPGTTPADAFVPGLDTITIKSGATVAGFLYDNAGNKSLSDQSVVILPQ